MRSKKGGFSLVQCPSIAHGVSSTSVARHARTSQVRVLGLVPRESERSGTQARYTRKPPREVRARAGTCGSTALRSKKVGFSLVRCLSIAHAVSATSAAQRAHVASERARPRSNRERAQWRASVLHAQATSRSEGQGWNVREHGLAQQEGRLLARTVPFYSVCSECHQRGAARAHAGSAHAGPPPKRKQAQWHASALHAQPTSPSEDKGWHVGALPCS